MAYLSYVAKQARRIVELIKDSFGTARAAGSVNGTQAEPGPGARLVTDAESQLSIAGGLLAFAGGKATPAWGDPGVWWPQVQRGAGLAFLAVDVTPANSAEELGVGWDANQSDQAGVAALYLQDDQTVTPVSGTIVEPAVSNWEADGWYDYLVILRTAGAYYFQRQGTLWRLLWISGSGADSTVYPAMTDFDAAFTAEEMRVLSLPLPLPIASDGFGADDETVSDGAGHGDGTTAPAVEWRLDLGGWLNAGGSSYAMALQGGKAIATLETGTPDVLLEVEVTRAAGTAGSVLRYADANNYVAAYHDGTNARLVKRVAGAETTVISAAAGYVAGARLRVICDGLYWWLYYNGSQVGARACIEDSALLTATRFGRYTTSTGAANSLDDFAVWALYGYQAYNVYAGDKKEDVVLQRAIYRSSIDDLDLEMTLAYPKRGANMPVLAVMHGYSGRTVNFPEETFIRMARRYGDVMCLFVNLRGSGLSEGQFDSCGREIQDIVDAVAYVKVRFADKINSGQLHMVGYSGGGANAFHMACKFPDYFNTIAAHFGISDFGYDPDHGWYQNGADAGQQALMERSAAMGGDPTEYPDEYHARAAVLAVSNVRSHLYIFHDAEDIIVPVDQSRTVRSALEAAGKTNFTYSETGVDDYPRWIHTLPSDTNWLHFSEEIFMPPILAGEYPAVSVPLEGTLKVLGWVDTKLFSLWLGDGTSEFGQVAYNATTRVFTITSETSAYTYTLKLKNQTSGASVGATINGSNFAATADSTGVATFTGSGGA